MMQAPSPKSVPPATPSLPPPQSTSETQMTLWKALEEGLQTQLTKHLAELIRRAQESSTPVEGEHDELR
jgi:hypothetical protein